MLIRALVAMSSDRGIGLNGGLPWHVPEDLKRFKQLTLGHSVLMGSKTYWSLPEKARPLPGRHNIVLTRNKLQEYPSSVEIVSDLAEWLHNKLGEQVGTDSENSVLWVIGGGEIYKMALSFCDELYVSLVKGSYDTDTSFPEFRDDFELVSEEDCGDHYFSVFRTKRPKENV
jgi:dihydrofolate reductase